MDTHTELLKVKLKKDNLIIKKKKGQGYDLAIHRRRKPNSQ